MDSALQQLCAELSQKAAGRYDVSRLKGEIDLLQVELNEKKHELQSIYATPAGKLVQWFRGLNR